MTAYEFWMPLMLLLIAGGGGIAYATWSARRLEKRHRDHPAE